jgi:hypothetical protein
MKSTINASRSAFTVDHDEWISYSHWGLFPVRRKSSNSRSRGQNAATPRPPPRSARNATMRLLPSAETARSSAMDAPSKCGFRPAFTTKRAFPQETKLRSCLGWGKVQARSATASHEQSQCSC